MGLTRREAAIAIAIVALLVAVALPSYRETRTKSLFFAATHMVGAGAFHLQKLAEGHGDAGLPMELPNVIDAIVWSERVSIFPADPFDRKSKNQGRVEGKYDRNGREISFRGGKLKYRRISDRVAVISSYGPDRMDQVQAWMERAELTGVEGGSHLQDLLLPLTFDPTNGVYSQGDIIRVVDLASKRSDRAPELQVQGEVEAE